MMVNENSMGITFSSVKCFSCGRFHANKCVCLDMHQSQTCLLGYAPLLLI